MDETLNSLAAEGGAVAAPTEPFQCPTCGQLLAPSCRVCVACRAPIDLKAIHQPSTMVPAEAPVPPVKLRPETVRFPWRILVAVMSIGMLLGIISLAVWGEEKGPIFIQSMPIFAGVWVFFDARRRQLPHPARWAIWTVLLLAIFLPWYLARRSKPAATVPFVEGDARFLLFAVLALLLIALILNILHMPTNVEPTSTPRRQPPATSRQVRLEFPACREPRRGGANTSSTTSHHQFHRQALSAPSEAWQT